ncbi:MAG: peptide chain release factor-like protein [Candidatus Omnitrophota bacterium]|nr:MAG: peptide chain release factor-like protein [Candidatus Omnitrophota bacterium]
MRGSAGKTKKNSLKRRMDALDIRERDLEEKFIRAAKAGGQNVNKVSSCVYLKHLPTGIEVKCQKSRYQARNRFLARRILADKIEAFLLAKQAEAKKQREKIRRQKRRRSADSKEKMLRDKKRRAAKKRTRAYRPSVDEFDI